MGKSEWGGVGCMLCKMLLNNDDHEHWAYVSSVACQFWNKAQTLRWWLVSYVRSLTSPASSAAPKTRQYCEYYTLEWWVRLYATAHGFILIIHFSTYCFPFFINIHVLRRPTIATNVEIWKKEKNINGTRRWRDAISAPIDCRSKVKVLRYVLLRNRYLNVR